MGERPAAIAEHIRQERAQLGEDISELRGRVKDSVNWRKRAQQKPLAAIGVAFLGGFLLFALLRR